MAGMIRALLSLFLMASIPGNSPYPAYKVIGNIYYVGADDITSYLITTPKGHIILNTGYAETVPIIRDNVQKLGFKLEDVKIMLNGQAHYDHVAGQRDLQNLTHAKIYSSAKDAPVVESGGVKDPRWGREQTYPPVKVDHIVRDGEKVTLGGVTLVAHLTPGHSPGCTTWTMTVIGNGKPLEVVFVGGTSINPGVRLVKEPTTWPGIAADFELGFKVLRGLKCDVFLGAHGNYYGMLAKRHQMEAGGPNPFIDQKGYIEFVDKSEKTFRAQVAAERGQ